MNSNSEQHSTEKINVLFKKDNFANINLIIVTALPVLLWFLFLGKVYYDKDSPHLFQTPIYIFCMFIPLICMFINLFVNFSDSADAPIIYGPNHFCFDIINKSNKKYFGFYDNNCGLKQQKNLLMNSIGIDKLTYGFNNTLLLLMLVITVILKKNILNYKSFRMFTAIIMTNGFIISLLSFIASLQYISAWIEYLMVSLLSVSLAAFLMVILGFNRIHFGFP
jgi:hypothetical protein